MLLESYQLKMTCILCKGNSNDSDLVSLSILTHSTLVNLFNSLAPEKFEWNFRYILFKLFFVIDGWDISCEIVLTCTPQNLTDDKSTLVQVMAWWHQATNHYLSQCLHRSMSPFTITRPQRVKTSRSEQNGRQFTDDIFRCLFFKDQFGVLIRNCSYGSNRQWVKCQQYFEGNACLGSTRHPMLTKIPHIIWHHYCTVN